ncbi:MULTISPECIES: DUF805 domain-containing protein [Acinetobacter Taxon 24D]|uniref:DUF805 domain-containing protein n=1 Tax=Acinetobacter Taxon 24D TaxID=2839057 RepID=UPI0010387768|nr:MULTISPECIES: DUF805 domain-containing protein [Acinetobacter Taxon 24D]NNG83176.1 DUF805 domain-containing protein [Acinetobacter sp. ANC 5378]NNG99939.1 DUF805 domain-containing protein [Acinetobacter sp. ANC 5414]TCH63922.1 DUF805 domain-containing protein [Acinetobacter sp. ANC 4862]
MKGSILDFSIQTNTGIISGDDQNRYNFTGAEWRGQRPPARGDRVDFDVDNAGSAIQIFTALGHSNPVQNISNQLDKLSDQNKAEEQFNMIDWFVKCLKNYVVFEGRARRKEFWFFYLACIILGVITQIIDAVLDTEPLFNGVLNLALLIPTLAAGARRLHDTNRSGWWQLLILTIIGIIPLIIWWASDTKRENNQWGQPAK